MTLYSKINDTKMFMQNFLSSDDFSQWFREWTSKHPNYHSWYISDTEMFIGDPDGTQYILTAVSEEIEQFFPRGVPDEV